MSRDYFIVPASISLADLDMSRFDRVWGHGWERPHDWLHCEVCGGRMFYPFLPYFRGQYGWADTWFCLGRPGRPCGEIFVYWHGND